MLTSLSKTRIEKHSTFVGEFSDEFAIYSSLPGAAVQQFYILPFDAGCLPRIEPLAHVSKRSDGVLHFNIFQPEKFTITQSGSELKASIERRLHEITRHHELLAMVCSH